MPLRILRNRNVAGANVIQALTVAGMFGMFFLGVLYLQQVLGYDALETGLANLPCTVVMAVLSVRYADRLVNRYGAKRVVVAGLVLATVGLGLYARIPVDGSFVVDVLPATILIGAGMGVSFPGLMMLAMSGVRPEEAGLASGLVNTTCQVGAALGLAVLATVSSGRTADLLGHGLDEATAAVGGFHAGFRLATALVAVAVLVAVVVVRDPRVTAEVDADAVPVPCRRRCEVTSEEPAGLASRGGFAGGGRRARHRVGARGHRRHRLPRPVVRARRRPPGRAHDPPRHVPDRQPGSRRDQRGRAPGLLATRARALRRGRRRLRGHLLAVVRR